MDEFTKLMLKIITELFGDNYLVFLFYLTILFLMIWLFREFRNKIMDEEKGKREKIENILIVLSDLQFELNEFLNNRENYEMLKQKLNNSYPFISYELSKDIHKFNRNISKTDVDSFIEKLNDEKDMYKYNQNDELSQINEKSLMRIIEYNYRSKFLPIINPFLLTLFSILIIMLAILMFLLISRTDSILVKYLYMQSIVNSIIFLSILISILDFIVKQQRNQNWKTWSYIITFLIFSILSFILFPKFYIMSPLLFIFYVISAILMFVNKNNIMKKDQNENM